MFDLPSGAKVSQKNRQPQAALSSGQMSLLCAIADPSVMGCFRQVLQQTSGEALWDEVTTVEQAIALLTTDNFDYLVIEASLAAEVLEIVQQRNWQIPAIALFQAAEDPLIETLLEAGIADYLDLETLTPSQLRRGFHHLQQLRQVQQQNQQLSQQLQRTNERYCVTIEASNDGIWDWQLSQQILDGNTRLWTMLGLAPHVMSLDLEALKTRIHPEDRPVIELALQRHLNDHEEFSVEIRLRHERGEYRDFWIRGKLQSADPEEQPRMCGLITDITERKRSDRHHRFLSQASNLLNVSLDSLTTLENLAWLAVPRLADWCILDIWIKTTGDRHIVTAHVDTTKEPLVHEFQRQLVAKQQCPQVVQFANFLTAAELEQLATSNGWSLPLLLTLGMESYAWLPLYIDEDCMGSIFFAWGESGRHCSSIDLALLQELAYRATWAIENARLHDERKNVYDDLQGTIAKLTQEQQRIETLQNLTTLINQRLTNIPELLAVLVAQICQDVSTAEVCSIALFDPTQADNFLVVTDGIHEKAIVFDLMLKEDTSWLHTIHQQGTAQIRNFDTQPLMPCSMAAVAIKSVSSGRLGVLVVGNWRIAQAFDHDDCEFLTAVGEEAAIAIDNARLIKTLEQQNQELIEISRAKDLFLANVSHELRTPMNAILGFSQVLLQQRQPPLGDRQQQIVERILSNGRSLMALINDILDFSQMKLTELQLLPSCFNLEALVSTIIAELQSLADEKSLTLQLFSHLTNPEIVHDHKRIRQVIVNLVANALSFTPQGSVNIYLYEIDDAISIKIQDTGIGIAPEHLENIFSEFWQVQQDLHRSKPGTGLGLAITHALVQRMQGAIAAESLPDQGSSFTVTIPRQYQISDIRHQTSGIRY